MYKEISCQRIIHTGKIGFIDETEFLETKHALSYMDDEDRRVVRDILSKYLNPDQIESLFDGTTREECA